MKSLLIASLMVISAPSFAKLAVYGNADAARAVLAPEVLSKVMDKAQTETFLKVAVENTKLNEFSVTVETAKLDWRCETVVKVKAVGEVITTPNGGKIATNKLVVGKIAEAKCIE
nr:hypothetical protein BHI3_09850 [Bacteriovorax sp. HI3]